MDSGSQRSYLTTKVKQDLRLESVRTQRLSIAAFGSRRAPAKPCDMILTHICDPLYVRPMSTGYQHLSDLNLADHYSESEIAEVDLLIRSDVYWDVITGEIIRGARADQHKAGMGLVRPGADK